MNYETTFICSPEVTPEKIEELSNKAKKVIEDAKGTVKLIQQLGKKKLAYPIKKHRDGSYVYIELSGSGDMVSHLENFFKVNDTIIRYLTVKVEPKKVIVKKTVEPVAPVAAPAVPEQPAAAVEVKTDGIDQSKTSGAE